jgi:putative membrane protein
MHFTSRLAWLAAVVLFCGCNRGDRTETQTTADTTQRQDTAAQPVVIGEPQILHILRTANSIESELGDMAATRAIDAGVRMYAQTVAADHRALNQVVDTVARAVNIIPAENPISMQMRARSDTVRANLSARAGGDFDRAYITEEAQFHQWLLDRIDRDLMRRTQRPEILQLIDRLRPALAAHLQMARGIQNRFAATTTDSR